MAIVALEHACQTDPVTSTATRITPSHPAFGQVADLFDDYRAFYGQLPSPQRTRDWLHGQLARHQMTITVALHAGQARGFITTTVVPASLTLGTAWSIRDLYVSPHHRRHGIARALLRHVIDDARAAGASRVSLQTETGNAPALALYTTVGFQPVRGLQLLSLTATPEDHHDC